MYCILVSYWLSAYILIFYWPSGCVLAVCIQYILVFYWLYAVWIYPGFLHVLVVCIYPGFLMAGCLDASWFPIDCLEVPWFAIGWLDITWFAFFCLEVSWLPLGCLNVSWFPFCFLDVSWSSISCLDVCIMVSHWLSVFSVYPGSPGHCLQTILVLTRGLCSLPLRKVTRHFDYGRKNFDFNPVLHCDLRMIYFDQKSPTSILRITTASAQ